MFRPVLTAIRCRILMPCLMLLPLFSGCKALQEVVTKPFKTDKTPKLSKEDLWLQLRGYARYHSISIQGASLEVANSTPDTVVRRFAISLKLLAIPPAYRALNLRDPRAAFIDLWAFVKQAHAFSQSELGQRFGEGQSIVISVFHDLDAQLFEVGGTFLSEKDLSRAQELVEEFAVQNPLQGRFARNAALPSTTEDAGAGAFASVLNYPLAPFKALQGIDEGAQAVREVARVADRFTTIVELIPSQVSWQLELLFLDTETSPGFVRLRENFDVLTATAERVGSVSERLASVAENLPAEIRRELLTVVDEVDQKQGNLQATLQQVRLASQDLNALVDKVNTTTGGFESTSRHLAAAGDAWKGALEAYESMVVNLYRSEDEESEPEPEPVATESESEGRPFDILDYAQTADSITRTAAELNAVLVQLDETAEAGRLQARLHEVESSAEAAIDHTHQRAQELTDYIFKRALQLLGVVMSLAVAYLVLRQKLSTKAIEA